MPSPTLAGIDGVASAAPAGAADDGSTTLVAGTLEAAVGRGGRRPRGRRGLRRRRPPSRSAAPAVVGLQIGRAGRAGPQPRRAVRPADPGRCSRSCSSAAAPPCCRWSVGITTVLGTFLALAGINQVYGLSVFALNLVIGLGLGLAIDYTLFLVSRYREELPGQGATAGRRPHDHGHRRPHGRLLRRHRRRRPGHADRLPDGLPRVDGHRRRRGRRRRRRRRAGDLAGRLRPVGRQARSAAAATRRRCRGPLVPLLPRRHAPPRPIAAATAAVMVVLAAPALQAEFDAGRRLRRPRGPELAHRLRHPRRRSTPAPAPRRSRLRSTQRRTQPRSTSFAARRLGVAGVIGTRRGRRPRRRHLAGRPRGRRRPGR